MPAVQLRHPVAPYSTRLCDPAEQLVHSPLIEGFRPVTEKVPGSHRGLQSPSDDAPWFCVLRPPGHCRHDVAPVLLTYLPNSHSVHFGALSPGE